MPATGVARPARHEFRGAQQIRVPAVDVDVSDTVDLDGQRTVVSQEPLDVEVAASARQIQPYRLASGLGEAPSTAEPDKVDLAERLRPAADVEERSAHQAPAPDPAHDVELGV